jgi:beta-glucosidase
VAKSGWYLVSLSNTAKARVYLDGKLLIESTMHSPAYPGSQMVQHSARVELRSGHSYDLKVEFQRNPDDSFAAIRVGAAPVSESDADRLAQAVKVAKECDAAVVFAGLPERYETEGGDRGTPRHHGDDLAALAFHFLQCRDGDALDGQTVH